MDNYQFSDSWHFFVSGSQMEIIVKEMVSQSLVTSHFRCCIYLYWTMQTPFIQSNAVTIALLWYIASPQSNPLNGWFKTMCSLLYICLCHWTWWMVGGLRLRSSGGAIVCWQKALQALNTCTTALPFWRSEEQLKTAEDSPQVPPARSLLVCSRKLDNKRQAIQVSMPCW